MRSPRLAALELRRFGRGKLPRAAMAAMLLLPLLYGALYLWSFWDPYDKLDKIPVALVNEDQGAKADGKQLKAGDDIVEGLHDSNTFDWHETDAKDAKKGLEDGRYYLTLRVPSDFSKRVASSSGDDPETGALKVETNDANNYIVGQISRSVFSEVRASASSKASKGFYDKIFVSFSTIHGQTKKAAKGADDLGEGIGEAKKGAGQLKNGLGDAKDGSGQLKTGTQKLYEGAGKLDKGAGQVADGTSELAKKANGVSGKIRPFLKDNGDEIGTAADDVARISKLLKQDLNKLPDRAQKAEDLSRTSADTLDKLYSVRCQGQAKTELDKQIQQLDDNGRNLIPSCEEMRKAKYAADTTAKVSKDTNAIVQKEQKLGKLGSDIDTLQSKAEELSKSAPTLYKDVDGAVAQINKLNKGAHQVSQGASDLHTGLGSAKSGASELDGGIGKLDQGAGALNGGMFKLADGSGKLAGGLHDGAKQIPDYDKKQRDDRSDVMSDPVDLSSGKAHAAPNYGTGFAPYFIPLALWVGAMIAYMLLQPLNKRALAAGAPAWRTALAGWLPVAAIGVVQVGALISVLHWGLGLEPLRGWGTVGFLGLVTLSFTAIVQFLNARFGPAGRILVLAMLMIQLTSAGGTYPIQTSPGFFNAVHPFLPMTYVVEGLRHLITGGDLWAVWRACLVLLAYTVGSLVLTALTARSKQVWTMSKLHPEISL